jgi:hypothetical protein
MALQRQAYWKLPDFNTQTTKQLHRELNDRGYRIASGTRKAQLVYHRERHERNLPSYVKYTAAELGKFARARGLIPSSGKAPSKLDLIDLLSEADENPRFERFAELPPELRVLVYEHYVEGFCDVENTLLPPPLALMSKQLMKEVMPVFYERSVFKLRYRQSNTSDQWQPAQYRPDWESFDFLRHADDSIVGQFRKFRIEMIWHGSMWRERGPHLDACFTVEAGHDADMNRPTYSFSVDTILSSRDRPARCKESLEAGLSKLLSKLNSAKKTKGFTMDDIKALEELIRNTMPTP